MTHVSEGELILYYYGEAVEHVNIEAHLASCLSCRDQYRDLQCVLAAADTLAVPERSAEYGSEIWQRLQPLLPRRRRLWWKSAIRPRHWAWAAGMAVLVLAAFLSGRYWRTETPITTTNVTDQDRRRVLSTSVADHLDRSRIVLIEIMYAPKDTGRIDIPRNQEWVSELASANRIFRQTAQHNGELGMASVLDDLERILLEVEARLSRLTADDLESIRQRIERQGILFKVRILENRLREQQTARRSS